MMFNPFSISGLLILITSAIMAVVMVARERSKIQVMWGIFCLLVAMWGLGAFKIGSISEPVQALLWWRIAYIGVIFIPALFTHFVHVFLGKKSFFIIGTLYAISAVYLFTDLFTNAFIKSVHLTFGTIYYLSPTPLYNSYLLLWVILIIYTHLLLFFELKKADIVRRRQIGYFFLGTFAGFLGGSFSFLPVYGFDIYPYENITVALYPIIMGYAILRYRLMSLKVVATQAFVAALWVFLFSRAVLEPIGSEQQIIDGLLLVVTIIIGLLLIQSVYREISQREEIERLSEEKSEFMSFASHEIRNPITAMRGYASLIVDGTTGEALPQVKDAAEKILVNGNTVLALISQFLNKSKLELGQLTYTIADFDVEEMVSSIADGFKPHAEQKGLVLGKHVSFPHLRAHGDEAKLREVIGNLIDNALKYTKRGSIMVLLEKRNGMARITIADTGVGIPQETISHLFQKFSRADAQKMNLLGTGLGLYLAKTFIEGMGGKIWAESDGPDKGSRFIIELPVGN